MHHLDESKTHLKQLTIDVEAFVTWEVDVTEALDRLHEETKDPALVDDEEFKKELEKKLEVTFCLTPNYCSVCFDTKTVNNSNYGCFQQSLVSSYVSTAYVCHSKLLALFSSDFNKFIKPICWCWYSFSIYWFLRLMYSILDI